MHTNYLNEFNGVFIAQQLEEGYIMSWKEEKVDSMFWQPLNIGESVEGEVILAAEGPFGMEYTLQGDETTIRLPSHTVLRMKMQNVQVGDKVKVVYDGERPSGKGKPAKMYDVYIWDESQTTLTEEKV